MIASLCLWSSFLFLPFRILRRLMFHLKPCELSLQAPAIRRALVNTLSGQVLLAVSSPSRRKRFTASTHARVSRARVCSLTQRFRVIDRQQPYSSSARLATAGAYIALSPTSSISSHHNIARPATHDGALDPLARPARTPCRLCGECSSRLSRQPYRSRGYASACTEDTKCSTVYWRSRSTRQCSACICCSTEDSRRTRCTDCSQIRTLQHHTRRRWSCRQAQGTGQESCHRQIPSAGEEASATQARMFRLRLDQERLPFIPTRQERQDM
jgi:hypothetical protein